MTFWATWCAPCMDEYPALVTIMDEFRSRGLTVLGVLHKDSAARALEYMAAQQGRTFITVVDQDERVAGSYLVRGIPRTFVIDPEGVVAHTFTGWGPGGVDHVRERIEELMAERGR